MALLGLALSAVAGGLASWVAHRQPVVVNVRWAPGLGNEQIADTERALGLARADAVGERSWRYRLADRSLDSRRAVVLHPLVEDTSGIDRRTLEVEAVPSAGWRVFGFSLSLCCLVGVAIALMRLPEPGGTAGASAIWSRVSLSICGLITVALAYWCFRAELPYLDMFRSLDYVGRRTWSGVAGDILGGTAEFRPFYFVLLKALRDLAGGPSQVLFRAVQIVLVAANLLLFRSVVGVRSVADAVGVTAGLFCFVGLHTSGFMFASALTPYAALIVNALVFGTLLLLRRKRDRLTDWAALSSSLVALLLIEYGVVVPLMWALAGALRLGSATRRTAWLGVGVILAYTVFRLVTNSSPLPGPFYTETGFLFEEHVSVEQQRALFGEGPWVFYLYNVGSTVATVLLSEPRAGAYHGVESLVRGISPQPWQVINWVTSVVSTILVVTWLARWSGISADRRRTVLLGAVVFAANCALGYLYTRDRIPTLAGAVYALFFAFAVSDLVRRRDPSWPSFQRAAVTLLLVVLGLGWGVRSVGTVVRARDQAWAVKEEWTDRYEQLATTTFAGTPPDDWRTDALREQLRRRAVARELPDPREDPDWTRRWFQRSTF